MDITTFDFSFFSLTCLAICLAYFAAGIIDAVCGGGGLLTVPVLMSTGMPAHMVVGTNQLSAVFGCGASLYKFTKSGSMNYRAALISLPFTIIGSLLGSRLNLILSEHYLQIVMLFLLPVLAVFSLLKFSGFEEDHIDDISRRRMLIGTAVAGLMVSTYHAFYGPASGMFYMLCFAAFLRTTLVKANGIARFELLIVNIVSGFMYALSGNMCWKVIVPAGIMYVLGNYIGAGLAISKGTRFIRPMFFAVLAMLFIKLIYDFFIA